MLPESHGPCALVDLVCQYGDDPRRGCRPWAICTATGWALTLAKCPLPPEAMCPASREMAAGKECKPMGAYCSYAGLVCECTNCTDGPVVMCGGPPTWHCEAPNPDPGCPAAQPNLGTACPTANQECTYRCGANGKLICKSGAWFGADGGPCPKSTRRAKKDIRYLDDEALRRVSDQLRHVKLASWEYADPALPRGRRLGFIIEDSPEIPAVDREREMVDLYGYAAMLHAATERQAREIEALRRDLRALERRLPQKVRPLMR